MHARHRHTRPRMRIHSIPRMYLNLCVCVCACVCGIERAHAHMCGCARMEEPLPSDAVCKSDFSCMPESYFMCVFMNERDLSSMRWREMSNVWMGYTSLYSTCILIRNIYIYIYISLSLSLSLFLYINMYIYIRTHTHTHTCIQQSTTSSSSSSSSPSLIETVVGSELMRSLKGATNEWVKYDAWIRHVARMKE